MKKILFVDIENLTNMIDEWDKKELLEFLNQQDFIIAMDTETKNLLKIFEKEINNNGIE